MLMANALIKATLPTLSKFGKHLGNS